MGRTQQTEGKSRRPGQGGKAMGKRPPAQKMAAKRHGNLKKDPYLYTPNAPAIKTMGVRAGVLSISPDCREDLRAVLRMHLQRLTSRALIYTAHARRQRINFEDVKRAIRFMAERGGSDALHVLMDEEEKTKHKRIKAPAAAPAPAAATGKKSKKAAAASQ